MYGFRLNTSDKELMKLLDVPVYTMINVRVMDKRSRVCGVKSWNKGIHVSWHSNKIYVYANDMPPDVSSPCEIALWAVNRHIECEKILFDL